jgi:integrase/recombinase XerD
VSFDPLTMFDQFLKERKYLKNISPKTEEYYTCVWKAFQPLLDISDPSDLTKDQWADFFCKLKGKMSPVSVNTYLRGVNAYLKWCHQEGYAKKIVKVPFLKTDKKLLAIFTLEDFNRLVKYKPLPFERRIWTLSLLLADTGLRISEALSLTKEKIDLDNLILKVLGKGGKERLVPFSIECRKLLWRYLSNNIISPSNYAFGTKHNSKLSTRNTLRDLKKIGKKVGLSGRVSPHTFRHFFAVNYLRNGGNLYYLQRILGHSSISTTELYLKSLGIADIQKVHSGLSVLGKSLGKT